MIVVFGSIGVDVVTRVERFPRPGETVACDGYDVVPGTKGANQALAARRAGARVVHVATRGTDPFGTVACSLLEQADVDTSLVRLSARPTGTCMIAVNAQGENAIVAAAGANLDTAAATLALCPFGQGDTLVLQREIRDGETFDAIRLGRARGARIILNVAPAAPVPPEILSLVDVLILNETEALVVAEAFGVGDRDPEEVGRLIAETQGGVVVVTLGAAGAVLWERGERLRVPAPSVAVVDTTAAGDSFVGFFAATLDRGGDMGTALREGVVAGSLCCTRPGAQTAIPTSDEVEAALSSADA